MLKKTISVLCVVFMLCIFTLSAVPASAVGVSILPGRYKINDTIVPTNPNGPSKQTFTNGGLYLDDGTPIYYFQASATYASYVSLSYTFYKGDNSTSAYTEASGWLDTKYQYLNVTEPLTLNESLGDWWATNVTVAPEVVKECDGTSCSWADADFDTICDTCGGMLLSFRYDLLEYAHTIKDKGLELFPETNFWLITTNPTDESQYTIFVSESPFVYSIDEDILSSSSSTRYTSVLINSDGVPANTGWVTISANSPILYGDPVDSATDIDGFFPPPDPDTPGGDGGATDPSNPGGDDSDDTGNLWDRLFGWLAYLKTIAQGIANLPQLIGDAIVEGLDGLFDWLLEGIRDLLVATFVPDVEVIRGKFEVFLDGLATKFNFNTDFLDVLTSDEKVVEDMLVDYELPGVGKLNLKVFDAKYLYDGVTAFRPYIRGFLVLMLGLYHVKMVLSFIRQDAGVATGKIVSMSNAKEG